MGALDSRSILVLPSGGGEKILVGGLDLAPYGLGVDSAGQLWASLGAPPGLDPNPDSAALLLLDPASGAILARHTPPPDPAGRVPRSFGEMAVAPDTGHLWLSDPATQAIVSFDPATGRFRSWGSGEFLSPQACAPASGLPWVFAACYLRGIARLDPGTGDILWLPWPASSARPGLDGLVFHQGRLYAVQNGAHPRRLLRLELNPQCDRITAVTVLARAQPDWEEPTQLVLAGDLLVTLANSHWPLWDEAARTWQTHARPDPARLLAWDIDWKPKTPSRLGL